MEDAPQDKPGTPGVGPATLVATGDDARSRVLAGVVQAATAVGATMGPGGHVALIEVPGRAPIVTKDGVTVCGYVNPRDRFARLGADLVKEAARKTNDAAGDGTTTASVLTLALCEGIHRQLVAGSDPVQLRTGIEEALGYALADIEARARKISSQADLEHVARISANGDVDTARLVAEAITRVGRHGIVTVEESRSIKTTLEVVAGTRIERGFVSPYFVNTADRTCKLDRANVFLTDKKIGSLRDILALLEHTQSSKTPLLLVADDFESEALQALVLNKSRNGLPVCAIRAPGAAGIREQLLGDLATLTGARLALGSGGEDLSKVDPSWLGTCATVVVDQKRTTFIGGAGDPDAIKRRAAEIETRLGDPTLSDQERTFVRARLAGLTAGIGVIKVGGLTELEIVELRHRIEDALNASIGAHEAGVVPGGGRALVTAASKVDGLVRAAAGEGADPSRVTGYKLAAAALRRPFETICKNAGLVPGDVERLLASHPPQTCYDIASGRVVDSYEAGVIDPVRVTTMAVANAGSVAKSFAALDVAIVVDG